MEILSDDGTAVPMSCFDLSAVGAYLHSDYLFSLGETIRLRIRIASKPRAIDIRGEVVRVETGENGLAPGMGIAFRKIADRDSDELKQFLLRRFLTHV